MNTENIYQSPESDLLDPKDGDTELASRWQRLGAALIDGIIGVVVAVALMYATGTWESVMKGYEPTLRENVIHGTLGFIIFLVMHGYLLKTSGQTIGKKIVGCRIVLVNDEPAPVTTIIFRRYLPVALVSLVPALGGLLVIIDSLLVFRADRRCVHDFTAETKVVRVKNQ